MWDRKTDIAGSTCNVDRGHNTGIIKSWLKKGHDSDDTGIRELGCREDMRQASGSLVVERT